MCSLPVHTPLDWLAHVVDTTPTSPAIYYFDRVFTYRELNELSDQYALALLERGLDPTDRVAIVLQNVPQFYIAILGTWKAGGIAVPLNPMYRSNELLHHVTDAGARIIVCSESLYPEVHEIRDASNIEHVVVTSELEYLSTKPASLEQIQRQGYPDTADWSAFLQDGARSRLSLGKRPVAGLAVLSYTSGTTGPPKGAMNSHANICSSAQLWRDWYGFGVNDVVVAFAPLFHITGLMGHLMCALSVGAPVVLMYRFDPLLAIDLIEQWQGTFTVAPITAYISLLECSGLDRNRVRSLKTVVSGGAPVPASTVERFEAATGLYIHNAYGLTESTSLCIGVPLGERAPIDEEFGSLSVGKCVSQTELRVVELQSRERVPVGTPGEILVRGPQVVPGYWGQEAESQNVLEAGWLSTGDIGRIDDEGWVYVIDRAKDIIIASGFKVWPREVEDVLYEHPSVKEAAVVGIPDDYRGETVKAFVSLLGPASPEEIIEHCRARLAAYKCPRKVEVVEELPKTASGKLMRRSLRALDGSTAG